MIIITETEREVTTRRLIDKELTAHVKVAARERVMISSKTIGVRVEGPAAQ